MSVFELFTTLPTSTVSPWEIRGLMFGDGLFETMLVWNGALPYGEHHRQRLTAGCARMGLDPDLEAVWSRLTQAELPERGILKLLVGRGGGGRGFLPDPDGERLDWATALLSPWHPATGKPVVVGPSAFPALPACHPLAGIKALSAAHWVQVRREAERHGWRDAVVADEEGFLTEGAGHNVFWLHDSGDRVVTPGLSQGILPGIGRERLIERLTRRGIAVEERPIHRDELISGTRLLLSNAVMPPQPAFWQATPDAEEFPLWLSEEVQAWPAP